MMIFDDCFDEEMLFSLDSDIEYDENAISAEPYFEYDNKMISCSFTGNRLISQEDKIKLIPKLKSTILYLISLGVKEFHCGGALGFDTLAASVVYDISRQHSSIRLILELPYDSQAEKWDDNDKRIYEFLKDKADEINIHSASPTDKEAATKALLKRNRILVDKCHYLVCYNKRNRGGAAYTINYAKLHDINILEME